MKYMGEFINLSILRVLVSNTNFYKQILKHWMCLIILYKMNSKDKFLFQSLQKHAYIQIDRKFHVQKLKIFR